MSKLEENSREVANSEEKLVNLHSQYNDLLEKYEQMQTGGPLPKLDVPEFNEQISEKEEELKEIRKELAEAEEVLKKTSGHLQVIKDLCEKVSTKEENRLRHEREEEAKAAEKQREEEAKAAEKKRQADEKAAKKRRAEEEKAAKKRRAEEEKERLHRRQREEEEEELAKLKQSMFVETSEDRAAKVASLKEYGIYSDEEIVAALHKTGGDEDKALDLLMVRGHGHPSLWLRSQR